MTTNLFSIMYVHSDNLWSATHQRVTTLKSSVDDCRTVPQARGELAERLAGRSRRFACPSSSRSRGSTTETKELIVVFRGLVGRFRVSDARGIYASKSESAYTIFSCGHK